MSTFTYNLALYGLPALAIGLWFFNKSVVDTQDGDTDHMRGRKMLTAPQAQRMTQSAQIKGYACMSWGDVEVPMSADNGHYLCIGATGTAKTMTLRIALKEALCTLPLINGRALVFDPKQDLLPAIAGISRYSTPTITNPFDARSAAWRASDDITNTGSALDLAALICPKVDGPNSIFSEVAQGFISDAIVCLITKGQPWTFSELILTLRDVNRLEALLRANPYCTTSVAYLDDKESRGKFLSNMLTSIKQFEPVAACWQRAKTSFSIKEWASGTGDFVTNKVLVLGSSSVAAVAMERINALLFDLAAKFVLSPEERGPTIFVLDELARMGKLQELKKLMTTGRSKGVTVFAAIQSDSDVRAVYGREDAEAILSQFLNYAVFKVGSADTASAISKFIGEQDVKRQALSQDKETGKESFGTQFATQAAVMPAQILSLPMPIASQDRYEGYFGLAKSGVFKATVMGVSAKLPALADVECFIPRNDQETFLILPIPLPKPIIKKGGDVVQTPPPVESGSKLPDL
jgi:type IV secretory pathway TraG/TraD family ATPase VirD4